MSDREVLANQTKILRNQAKLLANQAKLDRVIKNQKADQGEPGHHHRQPAQARSGASQPEDDRVEPDEDPRKSGEVAVRR